MDKTRMSVSNEPLPNQGKTTTIRSEEKSSTLVPAKTPPKPPNLAPAGINLEDVTYLMDLDGDGGLCFHQLHSK